jgi:addiction module HigA family antidote
MDPPVKPGDDKEEEMKKVKDRRHEIISHPGEILKDFLDEMDISVYALARAVDVPRSRINDIVLGRRAITADTALRLGLFFETDAESWLNLQKHYDMVMAKAQFKKPKEFLTAGELIAAE